MSLERQVKLILIMIALALSVIALDSLERPSALATPAPGIVDGGAAPGEQPGELPAARGAARAPRPTRPATPGGTASP